MLMKGSCTGSSYIAETDVKGGRRWAGTGE